MRSDGLAGAD
jgi:hypothetical protein